MSILQAINLNTDSPVAPTGHSNIVFQSDGGEPQAAVSAFDPLMIGDTGTGGFSGNVPAPAAGDTAAGKFLKADGTWVTPPALTNGSNASGYWVKDPTGHIRQWGVVATDINGGTLAVGFPINFTTLGSISISVTTKSAVDRITFVVDGSTSLSGFTIANNGSGGYAYWQADGF